MTMTSCKFQELVTSDVISWIENLRLMLDESARELQANELAPLSNLDEELDDLEDEEKGAEHRAEEEDFAKEGGTQHRLSPRLHDIEEEDDEDGRNTKERCEQLSRSESSSWQIAQKISNSVTILLFLHTKIILVLWYHGNINVVIGINNDTSSINITDSSINSNTSSVNITGNASNISAVGYTRNTIAYTNIWYCTLLYYTSMY
ncbi:hypothetical protein WN51_14519 [Melipona quadrifasciata]|uniref:Uncharacterized protein n=1 Tax=Melipona quadrifasciata TaxID=166423 RepID=A0A0M9A0M8_9HYME|nr:hypothetical protein WN51_14519 [Melipona quadrifasciata]